MAKRQDPPSFRAKRGSGTIEQIGGRWWWQRSRTVTNPDGSRSRKRWREGPFPTRKAAEAARRTAVPVSEEYARRLTWDEHLEEWLERYVVELLAEQQRSYAVSLRRSVEIHLRPRIGSKVMVETTVEDLKQLWRDLLSDRDGKLARSTVANIRSALSIAAEDASGRHLIRGNPVRAAKLPMQHQEDALGRSCRVSPTPGEPSSGHPKWLKSRCQDPIVGVRCAHEAVHLGCTY